jgi:hypothetical protein
MSQTSKRFRKETSRRDFIGMTMVTGLTGLMAGSCKANQSQNEVASKKSVVGGHEGGLLNTTSGRHFNFAKPYTPTEAREIFARSQAQRRVKNYVAMLGAPSFANPAMPYWWDPDKKFLIHPANLSYDNAIKAADYQLTASVLNFRASEIELGQDVFGKLTDNAQLQLSAGSSDKNNELVNWVMMTGVDIVSSLFSKKDGQLVPLTQNNSPTSALRPSEAVVVKNGICNLAMNVVAQKKKSLWDRLLAAVHAIMGSPVFGILPIPKLYLDAANSIASALQELTKVSNLITVLNSQPYPFKLYEGAAGFADMKFRPGHWVVVNGDFAASSWDADRNLPGVKLDIRGFYRLINPSGQPIDTTYTVAEIDLTKLLT